MKFLDVFNEIDKGNYALTDEAIYASLQNGDELIPLYGGNKEHKTTDRRISVSAKTKKGATIKIFSGEGIIISLDGSAGSMTYKNGEKFALNHHAGFITLREDTANKVNLEYFSLFLQNFYREMGVSDGSKTLSLEQVYAEEFTLPAFDVQCNILNSLKRIKGKLDALITLKNHCYEIMNKELSTEYSQYQGKDINISVCIDYMSGSAKLTEEMNYQRLKMNGNRYLLLTGSTIKENTYVTLNDAIDVPKFEQREGLLVTRKGKAGKVRYLPKGFYTLNDDAYILYLRDNSEYEVNLRWLSIQYKTEFLINASSSDNGTWNMTGFFKHTKIDIPSIEEQISIVKKYDILLNYINSIEEIERQYYSLISKEIA